MEHFLSCWCLWNVKLCFLSLIWNCYCQQLLNTQPNLNTFPVWVEQQTIMKAKMTFWRCFAGTSWDKLTSWIRFHPPHLWHQFNPSDPLSCTISGISHRSPHHVGRPSPIFLQNFSAKRARRWYAKFRCYFTNLSLSNIILHKSFSNNSRWPTICDLNLRKPQSVYLHNACLARSKKVK